jgi:hypothetical protein
MKFLELAKEDMHEHSYLDIDDNIYYIEEYVSGNGFAGKGNNLIINLKKSVDKKGTDQWKHKEKAIIDVALLIAKEMDNPNASKRKIYWLPIPPSRIKTDPLFDDRTYRILTLAIAVTTSHKHFVTDVLYQNSNRESFSSITARRDVDELVSNYSMNDIPNYDPEKDLIVIFDDMLTTGCHFKAVEKLVLDKYPDAVVMGIFVARRVIKSEALTQIICNA